MQTLLAASLRRHAAGSRAVRAIALDGRETSYVELLDQVGRCAAWLRREGCATDEAVGITVADEPLHMVASLALLWLGVPQVTLSSHDPALMRRELAQRLGVRRAIVADPQHALDGCATLLLTPETTAAETGSAAPDAVTADADAPAIHYVSSGTTGTPKVFTLSQRALAARADQLAASEWFGPGYRCLALASVEDPPGKSKRLSTVWLGATSVFLNASTSPPLPIQALCTKLRVTCLELSVLQLLSIVNDPADNPPFPACAGVYVSGSRVPSQLRQAFDRRFAAPLFVHYGAREIGRISTTYPAGRDHSLESVGVPVPWMDLEIVDGDGKALPPREVGEVRVRTALMAHSYHQDAVATARHFRDGWFYPGDLASLSPDGKLCIHGRIDDRMNLNSIKIFPAEIERVLEEHPGVRAAAAFARPSPVHGDIPLAAVELHDSATVAADELMAHARERLGVRAPRRIIVIDALPRTAAGKIAKDALIGLVGPNR